VTDVKGSVDLQGRAAATFNWKASGGAVTINGEYSGTLEFAPALAKPLRFNSLRTDFSRGGRFPARSTLDLGISEADRCFGPGPFQDKQHATFRPPV